MALKIADALAIILANAAVDALDVGAGSGSIEIYDGVQPANPGVAVTTQTKLVDFVLPEPAFGNAAAVSGGAQATAATISPVNALATGTATWFRAFDGADAPLFDGSVTDTAGAGDLKVTSTSIVSGVETAIVALTFTQPKGW